MGKGKHLRSLYYSPDSGTLDIRIGDPTSEVSSAPITENLVGRHDRSGKTIGFEIILLSRFGDEDVRGLPEKEGQSDTEGELEQAVSREAAGSLNCFRAGNSE